MSFTPEQVEQLLHPINPSRVLKDGKGHAHVSQQDVLAHLIRVFGFGNFDTEVMSADLIFEAERADKPGRFDVCYRAMVRLTVRDPEGGMVCSFENGSTATAQNQTRGDAHDLAYKSAISLSVKRAAIALGDQFGLSLYNKGQMNALVMGTLVGRDKAPAKRDMQDGVPQQVSLGNDEIETDLATFDIPAEKAAPAPTVTMSRRGGSTVKAASQQTSRQAPEAQDEWMPPTDSGPRAAHPLSDNPNLRSDKQSGMLHALLKEQGMGERVAALAYMSDKLNREVETSTTLTKRECSVIIDALKASS